MRVCVRVRKGAGAAKTARSRSAAGGVSVDPGWRGSQMCFLARGAAVLCGSALSPVVNSLLAPPRGLASGSRLRGVGVVRSQSGWMRP